MVDLDALGIDRATVERMYDEWRAGASKSALERRWLGKGESHGKLFSALVREVLGIETERPSRLSEEVARLRAENARLRAENAELRDRLAMAERAGGPIADDRT
jgi:hypothetical protein